MSSQETSGELGSPSLSDIKATANSAIDALKTQAVQTTEDARGTLNAMAGEARERVSSIVDEQKSVGAAHLSGLAKAAQTAAGDLDENNPTVARLVRDAAASVDHFADNLRNSDVRDVLGSVSSFARQQPVAFFAGSVLVGFALARFLKAEAVTAPGPAPRAQVRTATRSRRHDFADEISGLSAHEPL